MILLIYFILPNIKHKAEDPIIMYVLYNKKLNMPPCESMPFKVHGK